MYQLTNFHNEPLETETRPTVGVPEKITDCTTYAQKVAWCRKALVTNGFVLYKTLEKAGCRPENIAFLLRRYGLSLRTTRVRTCNGAYEIALTLVLSK